MEIIQRNEYEILVPTISNDGKPFRTRHHKVFDKFVNKITGGISIYQPIKGKWIDDKNDKEYFERMIPVRISATPEQIEKIADYVAKHYKQIAVKYTLISTQSFIKRYQ